MTDPEKPNMRGESKTQDKSNPNPANTTKPPPSLATRIQSSATGLAKSTFHPGSDQTNTLSSSTNTKASPSTPSTSNAAAQIGPISGPSGSTSASAGPSSTQSTFRSTSSISPAIEDEFQRFTEDQATLPASEFPAGPETPTPKGKERLETTWQSPNQPRSQIPPVTTTDPTPYLDAEDGAAVLALLASPSTESDPATLPADELEPTAAPAPLSAREREALDSFLRAVPGTETETQRPARMTGSSLVPDIDTFLSQGLGQENENGVGGTSRSGVLLRDEVLAKLPGAGDWVGVQERYHEEVWGFLEPVLEAARTEMESGIDGGEGGAEGPAVRRLRMVLGHMGG
ncbi:uncharacterized protein N7529_009815 [Penicillium soppii]|uniref:uncharacterized protein n=1 Tax=Penicillium soppii TaxID=69789 RepID=UPI0025487C90|nr:uncharacterized protein N7529_009815 [Penicillium soppii]KAJ5855871.1 hypothetical protein N7529_009815 [Penicillium soppii]